MKLIQAPVALIGLLLPLALAGAERPAQTLAEFAAASCRDWETAGVPAGTYGEGEFGESDIAFRDRRIGTRYRRQIGEEARVELEVISPGGRPTRFIASTFNRFGDPLILVALNSRCEWQVARRIDYADNGQALQIRTLAEDLRPIGEPDLLNPPLPPADPRAGSADRPLRVGMIDSGVNYLLPEINRRLARDGGELVGYDFWDLDDRPFDAHPVDSGFFVQRHGTRTASILLREAPAVELVPYRYPRPDMSRMEALIEHAADNGVAILGMPLGSNRVEDWGAFEYTARKHPQMLFVVSAGNDGRDIDEHPVYPAAIGLDNLVAVTSADDFLKPAERTNWGRLSVDFMVPAENLRALDFSGVETRVSGSSYAVSRVTALAARIKAARPELDAHGIIAELRARWSVDNEVTRRWVGGGYIADPLAGGAIVKTPMPAPIVAGPSAGAEFRLPLEVLVLDGRWSPSRIAGILQTAFELLAQCGIEAGEIALAAVEAPDYLRDLTTGNARTLLEAVGGDDLTVVLARDTRMQAEFTGEAFGIGNTSMRPWLTNSVWLMLDVDDPGIALAHEIYHVLANSGVHVEGGANLMQGDTRPDSTELTRDQCRLAQTSGVGNGLLQK